ncbi:MAG: AAA family ATPase [Thermostichales cyanobacterium SZTDM-1c_bins_54]
MATMIPGSLPRDASPAQKKVFKILYYDLPDEFSVWFEPVVNKARPDFVILGPTFGLLVLSLCDWEGIYPGSQPDQVEVVGAGGRRVQASPLVRPRAHLTTLVRQFRHFPPLLQTSGPDQGRLAFSVGYGLILSGIPMEVAVARQLFLATPQVVFRDELLRWDGLGERGLVRRLEQMFSIPTLFDALSAEQMAIIQGILHPESVIHSAARPAGPSESPTGKPASLVIKTLDRQQEALAKQIGTGHCLLYGVAGSGKTLVILTRARILAQQRPRGRIAILCYNIALAAYLRSLLAEEQGIEVYHFNGWAKAVLGELPEVEAIPAGLTYDEHLTSLLLGVLATNPQQRWDHLLVDEGHTFDPGWFRCLAAALGPEGSLLIAADASQSLYPRPQFTWEELGIPIQERFYLQTNYRNTQQILTAAWDVIAHLPVEDSPAFPWIQPKDSLRLGKLPTLVPGGPEVALATLLGLVEQGYRPQDLAVVYRAANASMRQCLGMFMEGLRQHQLPYFWVTENEAAKARYSAHVPGVRISTALSCLGLEFKAVLLLGLEQFDLGDPLSRRLLYVALTRAQDCLYVFGDVGGRLWQELASSGHWG